MTNLRIIGTTLKSSSLVLGNATISAVSSLSFILVKQSGCDIDFPAAMSLAVSQGKLTGTSTSLFNGVAIAVNASFDKVIF